MNDFSGKKIFITGGAGYLGRNLRRQLKGCDVEITAPSSQQADLRNPQALEPWRDVPFDYIFHLASWTQAGDFCLYHSGEQWLVNQQINTTVLGWWRTAQPQAKFVSMGTSCCYAPEITAVERNYLDGAPIKDLYTYAMTKRMLYIGQRSLETQFGLKHLTLVPSTLYGPYYEVGKKQPHFIFDLIRKISARKDVRLWGDGHQRRELIYIEDFIDDLLYVAPRVENEIVNIGGGEDYSIREFAAMICRAVGFDPQKIQYDTTRYVGARSKVLDISKLRALRPQLKRTPLREGIQETLAWMNASPKNQGAELGDGPSST